jgi:hypothetical protein
MVTGGTTIIGPQELAPRFVAAQFADPEGHLLGIIT